MAQEVLIDFIANTEGLEPAVDQLERLGTIDKKTAEVFRATNAELNKKAAAVKSVATAANQSLPAAKKSIDDVDKAVLKLTQDFVDGFQEGVTEELKKAGVTAEEFAAALKTGNTEVESSTVSLKAQLRQMTQQLAQMKLEGKDNTEEYKKLAQEAGHLQDAIADANQEVKNFGSDTSTFDGLISAAQGVAGGFALVQGAEGLFGDQSEELQETLLKVNSAMAILQGLQQVQTVLQKESAAATFLQTAGQKIYNLVIGESIGLMAAFRIALAATGVGLLILGIVALVKVLDQEEEQLKKVNDALDQNKKFIEADIKGIEDVTEKELERAQAAGAAESDLTRIRGRSLQAQRAAILEANAQLAEQQSQVEDTSEAFFKLNTAIEDNNDRVKEIDLKTNIEAIKLVAEQRAEQLKAISDTAEARLAATRKNSLAELSAAKSAAIAKAEVEKNAAGENAAQRLAIEANLQKQLRDLQRTFDQVRQQDRIAGIEAALAKEQTTRESITIRQGQAEIDLQKRLIRERAGLELLQEGLTQNQILDIKIKAQTEIVRLQREFNKQSAEDALTDFISANNAQLSAVEISNQEKLQLTIDNIIAQAAIEVEQNQGISDKIKEINAKRDADIKAARLASIQQTVNEEIELRSSINGAGIRQEEKELNAQQQIRQAFTEREKRAIEERLNVRRLSLGEEFKLIDELAQHDLDSIDLRLAALNDSFRQGLISYKQYNADYAKLTDDQTKVVEDAEQKKRDAQKQTEEAELENRRKTVELTVQFTNQAADIFAQFAQNNTDRQLNQLEQQRQEIEQQKKDGKISEKEAEARLIRLDKAEKTIRRQQAEREKRLAIFNAVIAVAAAIAKALPNIPLVAITAVLGAAQVAAIASKPIPQFRKGKKDAYQGPGVVGEAGAELVERNGQMYVAPKKTIVWLGAKDKVFNPKETKDFLEKSGMHPVKIPQYDGASLHGQSIDYEKLGKIIAKNTQGVSLNIDGYKDFVMQGHSFTTYLNNRRGHK